MSPPRRFRFTLVLFAAVAAPVAWGLPAYWATLQKVYMIQPDTDVANAQCLTCHVKPPIRNAFGKEVEKALGSAESLTAEMLHGLDSLDTDGDGISNEVELSKGSLPADPLSKPKKGVPAVRPRLAPDPPLIPNHSFHPLLVHFPIGLFLFGGFLDVLGFRSRRPSVREGATWNLSFGALAGLGALTTGLLARWRMGFELKGLIEVHFFLAITTTVLMGMIAYWNLRRKPEGSAYWTCLALACAVVAATGHFGSLIVHG
ncbi:MAG: hypothetical protein K8R88_01855 [Armatimonadetes bacterium]|nr:hypothetical protein [Armatimonadota bacterium]